MLQAVIFDMDGVLMDTMPMHNKVEIELFQKHGITMTAADFHPFFGMPFQKLVKTVGLKNGIVLSGTSLEHEKEQLMLQETEPIAPMPGIIDLLQKLKHSNIKTAVGSSTITSVVQHLLGRAALLPYFDAIATISDVKQGKPFPDIFLTAARQLQTDPSQCLVFEDATSGVQAAKAAGMVCFGYAAASNTAQDLSHADFVFTDFTKLTLNDLKQYFNH